MSIETFFRPDFGAYVRYCIGFCVRYFVIAGAAYGILHLWFRRRYLAHRIQQAFPTREEIGHEIRWSMSNAACTGLSTLLLYQLIRDGRTNMYFAAADRGWMYFGFSVLLGIVGYDAWFYWQHRLLHTRWLFQHAHSVHHRVTNPTPFAAFAHHPIETVMGNAYFILFVLLVPVHPLAIGLVGMWLFGFAIIGHLGYEFYPTGFTRHRTFQWFNTSTHHNMHHSGVRCNYGLCLNYWDRLMGTNHATYHLTFEEIRARVESKSADPAEGPLRQAPVVDHDGSARIV